MLPSYSSVMISASCNNCSLSVARGLRGEVWIGETICKMYIALNLTCLTIAAVVGVGIVAASKI